MILLVGCVFPNSIGYSVRGVTVMVKEKNYEWKYQVTYIKSLMEKIADAVIPEEKKMECPICGCKSNVFLPMGVTVRGNALCPVCYSLERHRALWMFCEEKQLLSKGGRMLHFAPESVLHKKFSELNNLDYWPVDINPNMPGVRKAVDITDIPFEDNSIDIIICNHVLEHIPDEGKALSELYRVLAQDGFAFLNVPIIRETTLENPAYNTPELRFKYYGQDDHVRAYGKDYPDRLRKAGFKVEVVEYCKNLKPEQIKRYGLVRNETFYICRK